MTRSTEPSPGSAGTERRAGPSRRPSALTAAALIVVALAFFLRPVVADFFSGVDERLIERIATVNGVVNKEFFTEPDTEAMREGAVRGMLEALGDQYTEYVPPVAVAEFQKRISGDYVGIGAEVRPDDGFLRIVSPMDDSPALKAGVQAGDLIVAVDGRSVYRLGADAVISLLQGEPGTTVRVTVQREADAPPAVALPASVPGSVELDPQTHTRPAPISSPEAEPEVFLRAPVTAPGPPPNRVRFDLPITRERIQADTVRGLHRDGDRWRYMADPERRIAYVRVSQFTDETMRSFPAALQTIQERGAKGLVIDLRFNAGGSLQAAVVLADMLLSEGVIVSMRGRAVEDQSFRADEAELLAGVPIAVIVNAQSASASEILAGAIKDNNRGIVVGERTIGKGLVQSVFSLPEGHGQLKLTTARYYLPSGRNINRDDGDTVWGVDPTDGFYVPVEPGAALDALVTRRNEEVLRLEADADPALWNDALRIRERLGDEQLNAALDALAARLDTGSWEPTGRAVPENGLALEELRDLRAQQERLAREFERVARRIDDLDDLDGAADIEGSDMLPDDAVLSGGTLTITGQDGETIGSFTITGETLERWLMDAPLGRRDPDAED